MLITEFVRVLNFRFSYIAGFLKRVSLPFRCIWSLSLLLCFYSVCLVGNELTGNTNLITHYNLEHAYNKFCGKKVKEKLSNFLPELPGEFKTVTVSEQTDMLLFPSGFIANSRGVTSPKRQILHASSEAIATLSQHVHHQYQGIGVSFLLSGATALLSFGLLRLIAHFAVNSFIQLIDFCLFFLNGDPSRIFLYCF